MRSPFSAVGISSASARLPEPRVLQRHHRLEADHVVVGEPHHRLVGDCDRLLLDRPGKIGDRQLGAVGSSRMPGMNSSMRSLPARFAFTIAASASPSSCCWRLLAAIEDGDADRAGRARCPCRRSSSGCAWRGGSARRGRRYRAGPAPTPPAWRTGRRRRGPACHARRGGGTAGARAVSSMLSPTIRPNWSLTSLKRSRSMNSTVGRQSGALRVLARGAAPCRAGRGTARGWAGRSDCRSPRPAPAARASA